MKHVIVILFTLLAQAAAMAGALSEPDARALRARVELLGKQLSAQPDVNAMVAATHSSAHRLAGGRAAFERGAFKQSLETRPFKIEQISFEAGVPTRTYLADKEEVCFVPTLEVVMMKHIKLKKVAYVVAIRPLGGGNKWTFLDSGAFTEKPELLYLFLPKLERGVVPPPNRIQRAG